MELVRPCPVRLLLHFIFPHYECNWIVFWMLSTSRQYNHWVLQLQWLLLLHTNLRCVLLCLNTCYSNERYSDLPGLPITFISNLSLYKDVTTISHESCNDLKACSATSGEVTMKWSILIVAISTLIIRFVFSLNTFLFQVIQVFPIRVVMVHILALRRQVI